MRESSANELLAIATDLELELGLMKRLEQDILLVQQEIQRGVSDAWGRAVRNRFYRNKTCLRRLQDRESVKTDFVSVAANLIRRVSHPTIRYAQHRIVQAFRRAA